MICYDYINEYIRKTIKRTDGVLADMEVYAKENHVPIIHPEVERFISVIGKMKNPKYILEVGTAIGYSAMVMSKFLQEDGRIDTIERNEKIIDIARKNVEEANLKEKINIIQGDAKDVLKTLDTKYDIVFIDAAKGHYLDFLQNIKKNLNKNAIIISDNVLYKGMVANDDLVIRRKKTIVKRLREYLDCICNNELLDTTIIPIGDGVAVSYVKN